MIEKNTRHHWSFLSSQNSVVVLCYFLEKNVDLTRTKYYDTIGVICQEQM